MLPLSGLKELINVKCTPMEEHDWPEDREMATPAHGSFMPGEVKRIESGPDADRLIASGEFELTDEEPNTEEIRLQISQAVVERRQAELEQEPSSKLFKGAKPEDDEEEDAPKTTKK